MKPFRPSRRRPPAKKPAARPLPSLEALESRWLPSTTPLTPVLIVDNGEPAFTTTGVWQVWTGSGYHNDVSEATGRAGSDTGTWTFANLTPGQYRVSVTWTPWPDRATNAPYTVLSGGATLGGAAVNQQSAPADLTDAGVGWKDLGNFSVQGSDLAVKLSDLADGNVIADAVRVEWVAALPAGPTAQVMDGTTPVPGGGSDGFGSTFLGTDLTKTFTVSNAGQQDLVLSGPIGVPAGFRVVSCFGATTLAPGASTTFTIGLDGSVLGTYSGQVSFGTNDTANNPFSFAVSGTVSPVKTLDDGDPGFSTTGTWLVWPNSGGFQGDVQEATGQTGADVASWTFANVLPGVYRVSVTWTAYPNRATNAPYTVLAGSTALGTVAVNQQLAPADFTDAGVGWKDLGTFAVGGGPVVVQLSDAGVDGSVIADGVRLEWVGPLLRPPQAQVLDGTTPVANNGSVGFGSTLLGGGLVRTFTVLNAGQQDLVLSGPIGVPAGFSVASGFGATTLAPGASTTFAVRLDGSALGTYSGQVTFGTNDPSAAVFGFAVSGTVSPVGILDDSDPDFSTAGTWSVWNTGGFRSDVREAIARTGSDIATWTFRNLVPGVYRVAVTWTAWPDRATNAPYTVTDGGASLGGAAVNQQLAPADFSDAGAGWKDLGTFQVTGTSLVVHLSDGADGNVIADAVRVERLGDLPPPPPPPGGGHGHGHHHHRHHHRHHGLPPSLQKLVDEVLHFLQQHPGNGAPGGAQGDGAVGDFNGPFGARGVFGPAGAESQLPPSLFPGGSLDRLFAHWGEAPLGSEQFGWGGSSGLAWVDDWLRLLKGFGS